MQERKRKTHCKNGHPFDETNTKVEVRRDRTVRQCRTCTNASKRRWNRDNDWDRVRIRKPRPKKERLPGPSPTEVFWSNVPDRPITGCWAYRGRIDPEGYGVFRTRGAHRYSYELLIGEIPAGLQLDHLCRVRACVNPAHLEPVTNEENTRRSTMSLNNPLHPDAANRTHCCHGHLLDPANVRIKHAVDGYIRRICRACERNRVARRSKQHKRKALQATGS